MVNSWLALKWHTNLLWLYNKKKACVYVQFTYGETLLHISDLFHD